MTYAYVQGCVADGVRKCGSCVRKCGVGGREMCRDELVDGTASNLTVPVGGAVLVVMSVFSSMVMMIIR